MTTPAHVRIHREDDSTYIITCPLCTTFKATLVSNDNDALELAKAISKHHLRTIHNIKVMWTVTTEPTLFPGTPPTKKGGHN